MLEYFVCGTVVTKEKQYCLNLTKAKLAPTCVSHCLSHKMCSFMCVDQVAGVVWSCRQSGLCTAFEQQNERSTLQLIRNRSHKDTCFMTSTCKVQPNLYSLLYSFIHSVICLTTGPKPLPKRFLHIARSRASSFK